MSRDEIRKKIDSILTEYLRLEEGEIQSNSHIVDDLGADSLALVELGFKFSDTFDIPMLTPEEDLMIFENLLNHVVKEMEAVAV